jgi:hypothetical protein
MKEDGEGSRVLEKLITIQLVKKFVVFYRT